jgi:signal transduction histidine kinase
MKLAAIGWALLGVITLSGLPSTARGAEEARVLILNGLDPYLPAYLAIDGAMRASFARIPGRPIVLYSEPLDAQRFAIEPLEPEFLALLAKKYRALRIDVVVAVTKPAIDFFMRHGEALWPGARLVFHGYPDPGGPLPTFPPGVIGLVNRDDFGGTVALARRLQPGLRRIVVVAGVSPLDRELEGRARQVLPALAGSLPVEFLSGWPLPALEARMAAEPSDSAILYLTQFRDRDGRPYLPREVLSAISRVSAAPVYGLFETYLGFGVASGSMEFYEDRGRLVGQLVRDVVAGRSPDPAHAVQSVASRCVADARALERWSLDRGLLPPGCDIRFAERAAWREYGWQIAAAIAVIAGQALLIAALLSQRRRRRAAEADSQRRFAEMTHMNRRVAMGGLAASIAHELNQPLGAIHNNASAAQILIQAEPPRLGEVAEILEDIKHDDRRASEVIARIRNMLRKSDLAVVAVDVNETIEVTQKLVTFDAATHGVDVRTELEPGLPAVRADRIQVQQVLLNLALNAMEAMHDPPRERKQLILRSRAVDAREAEISVIDSGAGIREDMLPRIFDPFVTSKSGGMGLGLSISRTIIEAFGGRMRAENLSSGGAAFHFTLPFAAERTA